MIRSRNPTTIPYQPMFMDEPQPLKVRMQRQRLAQFWRGRRWVRRGQISRVHRGSRITGMVCSDPPGIRDRRIPRDHPRQLRNDGEWIIMGVTPGPRFRPHFIILPREAIREFNAAMRAFREAQYQ